MTIKGAPQRELKRQSEDSLLEKLRAQDRIWACVSTKIELANRMVALHPERAPEIAEDLLREAQRHVGCNKTELAKGIYEIYPQFAQKILAIAPCFEINARMAPTKDEKIKALFHEAYVLSRPREVMSICDEILSMSSHASHRLGALNLLECKATTIGIYPNDADQYWKKAKEIRGLIIHQVNNDEGIVGPVKTTITEINAEQSLAKRIVMTNNVLRNHPYLRYSHLFANHIEQLGNVPWTGMNVAQMMQLRPLLSSMSKATYSYLRPTSTVVPSSSSSESISSSSSSVVPVVIVSSSTSEGGAPLPSALKKEKGKVRDFEHKVRFSGDADSSSSSSSSSSEEASSSSSSSDALTSSSSSSDVAAEMASSGRTRSPSPDRSASFSLNPAPDTAQEPENEGALVLSSGGQLVGHTWSSESGVLTQRTFSKREALRLLMTQRDIEPDTGMEGSQKDIEEVQARLTNQVYGAIHNGMHDIEAIDTYMDFLSFVVFHSTTLTNLRDLHEHKNTIFRKLFSKRLDKDIVAKLIFIQGYADRNEPKNFLEFYFKHESPQTDPGKTYQEKAKLHARKQMESKISSLERLSERNAREAKEREQLLLLAKKATEEYNKNVSEGLGGFKESAALKLKQRQTKRAIEDRKKELAITQSGETGLRLESTADIHQDVDQDEEEVQKRRRDRIERLKSARRVAHGMTTFLQEPLKTGPSQGKERDDKDAEPSKTKMQFSKKLSPEIQQQAERILAVLTTKIKIEEVETYQHLISIICSIDPSIDESFLKKPSSKFLWKALYLELHPDKMPGLDFKVGILKDIVTKGLSETGSDDDDVLIEEDLSDSDDDRKGDMAAFLAKQDNPSVELPKKGRVD